MKSAEVSAEAMKQGLNLDAALSSLVPCDLQYHARVPIAVYRAARQRGWRFFPVPQRSRSAEINVRICQATENLEQLKCWARKRPNWGLAAGSISGVLVLVVDGQEGQSSLLAACGDDWDWFGTLRSTDGQKRYIFFAWPEGRKLRSRQSIGKGLYVLGDGDWLLIPPSCETSGRRHVYLNPRLTVIPLPEWILSTFFKQESAVGCFPPIPVCSDSRGLRARSVATGAGHT